MTTQPSTKTPFSEINGMGQSARNALAEAGYVYLEELNGASKKELAKLHAMGPKALREELGTRGLGFAAGE